MNKYKILVVESTQVGRVLLETIFEKEVDIFFAFNSKEALKLIHAHNGDYDLILFNFSQNDLDCFEMFEILKNDPQYKNIPLVVITDRTEGNAETLKKYNIEDVIYKPYNNYIVKKRIINIIKSNKFDHQEESKDFKSIISETDLEITDVFAFPIKEIPSDFGLNLDPENFYDLYRIVNPTNHRIYRFKDGKISASNNACYYVWNRKKPCTACVSERACKLNHDFRKIERFGNRFFSIVAVPLKVNNATYSVELIKDLTSNLLFSDGNTDSFYSMEEFMAQYHNLGDRDTFTNLHSKAFINQQISEYLERDIPITIAFIDLNYFKNINDTFGHVQGDEVLLFLSKILANLEDSGAYQCARVGGDEFIILAKTSGNNLINIVPNINDTLRKHVFETNGEKYNVSFSYGIANSVKDDSLDTLIDRADKLMYVDKSINKR